jgi:hypothetical protein
VAAENTFPAALPEHSNPTEQIPSRDRNRRRHHEVLRSPTTSWTADRRFWVSVQDNGGFRKD